MSDQGNNILTGSLIGGLVGVGIGLLLAPKSGEDLRECIVDGYNCVNEKTQELAENIKCAGKKLMYPFQKEEEEYNSTNTFLVGALMGAVIGVVAAMLLAPKSGKQLREYLGDTYEDIRDKAEDFISNVNEQGGKAMDQMSDWKDSLATIIQKLTSSSSKGKNSKMNELLHWATIGMQLFNQAKGRR